MNKFSAVKIIPMWDAKRAKDNPNSYHTQNEFQMDYNLKNFSRIYSRITLWSQGKEGFLKPKTKSKNQKEILDTFKPLYNKIHHTMKRQFKDWGKVTALYITKKGSVSRKKKAICKKGKQP